MSELERENASLRAAVDQVIGIGERLQARIDGALEILEQHAEDPVVAAAIERLEGR